MEVINQILKLKKQLVEKSLAELVKSLAAIEFEIIELENDRDNKRLEASQTAKTNSHLSAIDFQIDQKWRDQLNQRLVSLKNDKLRLHTACESVKVELRGLSGKEELSEKQLKASHLKHHNERLASEGEQRLENWRISKLRNN